MKPTKQEEEAYHSFVHTPTIAANAFIRMAEDIYGTKGVSSGSKVIDHYVIPTRPGWVRYWLARPGEGKTTALRSIAINEAHRLSKNNLDHLYYVAHITWEESVDGQEIYYHDRSYSNEDFWHGKIKPERVIREGIKRPQLPIYVLGDSMIKSDIDSKPMTVERSIDALRAIFKIEGKRPSLIVCDYAQEIEVDRPGNKRTEDIVRAVKSVIKMGIRLKCPIELGVQAKQTSMDRRTKDPKKLSSVMVPDQRDIEWAFYIHQKAHVGIGLWRPWITEKDESWVQANNPMLRVGGSDYPMSPNLMVAKPIKHRPGLLRMMIPYELYPDTLTIKDFNGLISRP